VAAVVTLVIGLVISVAVFAIIRSGHPPAAAADTRPLATAGAMPPEPRINGVEGELGSYCWTFAGDAIFQAPSLIGLPSPIPTDYTRSGCVDVGPNWNRFAPPVSGPLSLWLPNVRADVTAQVEDQNGATSPATIEGNGKVVLPPGTWTSLTLSVQWPGAAPPVGIGDAGYAWTLR